MTIIATGFAESYEEQLLSGGAAARRGASASSNGTGGLGAGRTQGQAGSAGQWTRPERASRPYLGKTVF